MMKQWIAWTILFLLGTPLCGMAQGEHIGPVRWNPLLIEGTAPSSPYARKTTATIGLPFFEDFTDYALFPNSARWTDSEVYINNTMCVSPIARGVATFDALNKRGRPYDTTNRFNTVYADSLTSQPIDLSGNVPGDSIYLSFFYQPQGNGNIPEDPDSFMLFFHRKSGGWAKMWAVPGTEVQPFRQVMIRVTDTQFFSNTFQFRFVNKASINTNDDIWNLDYIRMGANRSITDTAVRDFAFTTEPTFLLNDYTAMPYRQFLPNAAAERRTTIGDSAWNHYPTNAMINHSYNAIETTTGTPLGSTGGPVTIPAYKTDGFFFPAYTTTVTPPDSRSRIVYRNTFFLQTGTFTEPKDNDSIVREQIFDNYLAYDDGTAEVSYFLDLFPGLPAKTAIEFRLNVPDTLRGIAIYFGQQVPTGVGKYFSAAVYSKLGGIAGGTQDVKLYEQELLLPMYTDQVNRFTVYRFDTPLELPAGVFYLGTTQPASSGSDSLYIGWDRNRVGGNHLYYNTLTTWHSSGELGALMVRPLLGGHITGTAVDNAPVRVASLSLYPNPCRDVLHITGNNVNISRYLITDMQGRMVGEGQCSSAGISVSAVPPGMYMLRLKQGDYWSAPQKFVKQ